MSEKLFFQKKNDFFHNFVLLILNQGTYDKYMLAQIFVGDDFDFYHILKVSLKFKLVKISANFYISYFERTKYKRFYPNEFKKNVISEKLAI